MLIRATLFFLGVKVLIASPNIVFILLDDIGWNDIGYNSVHSPIPTPFIDSLAKKGVVLKQHYVHAVCTPSRAALLTGRYHVNVGLTNVLLPGSPTGLSPDISTLPSLLKLYKNYSTAMVGKWHLGHAQHKMTPTGRGFDSFTGMYMWDLDSYTKQMYEVPWEPPMMIDWVKEYSNGSYMHYAEPLHATEAITLEAQKAMQIHCEQSSWAAETTVNSMSDHDHDVNLKSNNKSCDEFTTSPLFLYIAYTAAHSPLQPLVRHMSACKHISHPWRRAFCGMVVGLDEGLHNLTNSITKFLGEDTILVVSSDNGGSPWFGGMNYPLRGSKATPLEGGIRVPAFIVDFTQDQRYLGNRERREIEEKAIGHNGNDIQYEGAAAANACNTNNNSSSNSMMRMQRVYHPMMHISDWLPTLLRYADVPLEQYSDHLDGLDFSDALRTALYEDWNTSRSSVCIRNNNNDYSNKSIDIAVNGSSSNAAPRTSMLLEIYSAEESVFNESLIAYRLGDYKYIRGIIRDNGYYYESPPDTTGKNIFTLNSSHITKDRGNYILDKCVSYLIESAIRILEAGFGVAAMDMLHITMVHVWLHNIWTRYQRLGLEPTVHLYNIAEDPCERNNLAATTTTTVTTTVVTSESSSDVRAIIAEIESHIALVVAHRPTANTALKLQMDLATAWKRTLVTGDCSMNSNNIPNSQCWFTHSWIDDNVIDPFNYEGLMTAAEYMTLRMKRIQKQIICILTLTVLIIFSAHMLIWYYYKKNPKEEEEQISIAVTDDATSIEYE